ncbi:hypothetical protein SLEP1_g11531 [Rubroshorea leprosula]|nr:hypothetical protein SLEP1_g11531 [Rubroshorea leprosula]
MTLLFPSSVPARVDKKPVTGLHLLVIQKRVEPEANKMVVEQPRNDSLGINSSIVNEKVTGAM